MTVQKDIVKNIYVGNSSTTVFPFTFECPSSHPEYIKVYIAENSSELVETTNFNVDMGKKNITYPAAGEPLAANSQLVIMRELPIYQLMNLINNGPYFAEDIETAFDEGIMIMQQLYGNVKRCIKISNAEDADKINLTIPLNKDEFIKVNQDGTGFETESYDRLRQDATAAVDATVKQDVKDYIETHPEYVTTVMPESVDEPKLAPALAKKKASWYQSVEDMKADRLLKVGMTACTLGYYEPNDGGAGTYYIRAKAEGDVDDGGSLHELANGNVTELVVENGTVNTKQLNLSKDDTDGKNLGKLVAAINKGFAIRFLDLYRVICTETQELKKDLVFIGENSSCGLIFSMQNTSFVFTYSDKIKNIILKNMYFESELQDTVARLFHAISTSKNITNMDKFICDSCVFKNNATLQRSNDGAERIYNDAQELPKISVIIFKNNRVYNCNFSFADFSDCCFDTCIIENNNIKNVKYLFFSIANANLPDNASELWKDKYNRLFENMKNLIVRNNHVVNESTIVSSTTAPVYCGFIVAETQNVVYTGNYVEGIVSDNGAVYDAYLSCKNVTYTGNIWKNNVAYAQNDNNNFIKCKGNGGVRTYSDNKFIVEKSFVDMLIETYGADRTKCAVGLCSLTSEVDISIENNTFEADVLLFFTSNAPAKTYIFRNNYIKINQYLGNALLSCTANARAIFENNFLYCTEGNDTELKVAVLTENQNITLKNNTFIFKNVHFVLSFPKVTSFFENQNNNFYTELGYYYFLGGVNSKDNNITAKRFKILWNIAETIASDFKINSDLYDVRIGVKKQGVLCFNNQTFFTADGEKEQKFSYKLYEKDGVQRYNINIINDKTYDDIVPESSKFIKLPFAGRMRVSKAYGVDYLLEDPAPMCEWKIKTFVDVTTNVNGEPQ